MSLASNPLLKRDGPVLFDAIQPRHVGPAVGDVLSQAQTRVDELVRGTGSSYRHVVEGLNRITESVSRVWAPVTHLTNVASSPELRRAHGDALPHVVRFSNQLHHNRKLYRRLREVEASPGTPALPALERRHLSKTLREFRRAGAELSDSDKGLLEGLRVELSELGRVFQENVLKDTADYGKLVDRREALAGLPETTIERARHLAAERGEPGWLITLDMPTVQAVLQHARSRALRREIHTAYMDRCTGGERDNRPLIAKMLELRRREAAVLGYRNYPDYRLEEAMAGSGHRVRAFLDRMIENTQPFFDRDVDDLRSCAERLGMDALEPWDVSHIMEELRRARFNLDEEALRPWFPLNEVQRGLFDVAESIFGLSVVQVDNDHVWHPDVRFFEVRDPSGLHVGSFYTDWFPRDEKRQGAWMDNLITGGPRNSGHFCPHLGFIGGNFSPPTATRPSLLTHREVQTLFHEFGHLLHHVASRVGISARAGVNVAWDWVEVPSQIMENWAWEREALDRFARHHETGQALPGETLERLVAARRFMGGWLQMRQLSLAHLDLELHRSDQTEESVMGFAASMLRPFVPSDRFVERHILPSFSHLFGGGYASAYYSYLWSEVLEADAFTRFAQDGIMNPETGRDFVDHVLSQGDARDPEELFRAFVKRDPDPQALIRRNLGLPR